MSIKALAEQAGVDRGRLTAIEDGASARTSTVAAIEGALNRLEEEMGGPYESEGTGMVTYRLSGNFGVDVTLEGPVSNMAELEAAVARLLAQMQQQPPST